MSDLIWILIGISCLCLIWLVSQSLTRKRAPARGGEELDHYRMFLNEKYISVTQPIHIGGKPDQVWKDKDRNLIVTDTKKRARKRVYDGDRAQLSAYAYILRHNPKYARYNVKPYGYMRLVVGPESNIFFVRVELMADFEVEALYDRATMIKSDLRTAVPRPQFGLCSGCGHTHRCPTPKIRSKRSRPAN